MPPLIPLNAEDWPHRLEEFGVTSKGWDYVMFSGYVSAIDRIVPVLKKIAESAENFEQLKAELLTFAKQQEDFSKDVDARWYNNIYSEELLGLPASSLSYDHIPDEVPKRINRDPLAKHCP